MADPLSVDIVNALSEDSLPLGSAASASLAPGNFGALMAGDPGALLSQTPVEVEAAAILDLVDQGVTQSALLASGANATVAAATLDLSPEAIAQASATGFPALLFDDTPAFPRSTEARRLNSNGDVLPISGLDSWHDAIQLFRENDSDRPIPEPQPPEPRVCPFCGKIHTIFAADSLDASEASCAAHAALRAAQEEPLP